MAKAVTKKNEEVVEYNNSVAFEGVVKKILYFGEKVASYSVENTIKSPKGNAIKAWVTVKEFNPEVAYEEGDVIFVGGHLASESYEDKKSKKTVWSTVIIAEEIKEGGK